MYTEIRLLNRSLCITANNPALWLSMVDIRICQPLFPRCATRPGATPPLDPIDVHAFMCKIAEGATRRHNALRFSLALTLSRPPFSQSTRREVTLPHFLHSPHPKRVDILVNSTPEFHASPLALDVTIRCPYTLNVLPSAAHQASAATNRGEQHKVAYYRTDCEPEGWDFYPVAFDTFASPGSNTKQLFAMWAQAASAKTGSPPAK